MFVCFKDNHLNKEAKQERLEKMIRDAFEDNNSDHQTPGAPTTASYHSSTSLRQAKW